VWGCVDGWRVSCIEIISKCYNRQNIKTGIRWIFKLVGRSGMASVILEVTPFLK
jgi:hypothetical protein